MRMINLLQINDLDIKSFLKIILAIQLAVWGVIGLDTAGLQIPIIRQFIGFIYLTFVPGVIILRILKLHKLGNTETLLYTVGLSIATLMFTVLFMNTIYPFFGISGPISIMPLIITISIVVLVLCILSYVRDNDFSDPSFIDGGGVLSPPALFLCLIPFLAVFGTYLVNFHQNNILLMLLMAIIALIAVLVAFDKFIPKRLFPLAIFVIAIALLWHKSLISMYLTGWDIHSEYYFYKLTEISSYWDWTIPNSNNAMLSDTILPSIHSYLLNIDGAWIYKIIYPVFFSLVPLGLYYIYQKQTDDRTAFLSVFFFMSFTAFYCVMISLAKQQIAMLFFVLLILSMLDKKIDAPKRAALSIIFCVSMVVSHYGTTYITIFYILMAWILLSFMKNATFINRFWQSLRAKFNRYVVKETVLQSNNTIDDSESIILKNSKTITVTFVILYSVIAVSWYMYVSSSTAFNTIVNIGGHVYYSIYTDFFNPAAREGSVMSAIGMHEPAQSLARNIKMYLFHATQLFIIVGVIRLLIQRNKMKFEREYIAMTLVSTVIILMCIILPFFSGKLHMDRIYLILLFFLSPFCILGGETVFKGILESFRFVSSRFKQKQACATDLRWYSKQDNEYSDAISNTNKIYVLLVLIVLIPYFLFNTGFVYEVTGDVPTSISLSMERTKKSSDGNATILLAGGSYEQNVFSARWLSKSMDKKKNRVYSDTASCWYVLPSYGMIYPSYPSYYSSRVLGNTTRVRDNSYIYLSHRNVVNGLMTTDEGRDYNTIEISPLLWENNKIYSNGDSEIYYCE